MSDQTYIDLRRTGISVLGHRQDGKGIAKTLAIVGTSQQNGG
ncbi:hypothetical protein SAMN06295912_1211 [Sphingomonas laterariae]|uniref:Uncharacterized protein n=1 Tax=Edaphosphingomonas laterariae TaxID=861865 RepID=A0A239I3E2_9SPHN|nr:hypothetical protein [Sphingomonas laterariae]SNS87603.1 hypothetical protein SAMN06295912_1211 [Sphingomonas laterariae]